MSRLYWNEPNEYRCEGCLGVEVGSFVYVDERWREVSPPGWLRYVDEGYHGNVERWACCRACAERVSDDYSKNGSMAFDRHLERRKP